MTANWPAVLQAALPHLLLPDRMPGCRPDADTLRYGRRGSLAIHVRGPRAGTWHDFEADCGGGVLDLIKHLVGVDQSGALDWLKARGLIDRGPERPRNRRRRPGRPNTRPRTPAARPAAQRPPEPDSRALAILAAAQPIPEDAKHPARRWRGGLIEHGPALRWIEANALAAIPGRMQPIPGAAGAIVVPLALPETETGSVQLLYVGPDGKPHKAAGRDRSNYGKLAPFLTRTPERGGVLLVAEGVADALALAGRWPWPACAAGNADALHSAALLDWIVSEDLAAVFCCDGPKPDEAAASNPGAGIKAARKAVKIVRRRDGRAIRVNWPVGKDPGDTPDYLALREAEVHALETPTAASSRPAPPERPQDRPKPQPQPVAPVEPPAANSADPGRQDAAKCATVAHSPAPEPVEAGDARPWQARYRPEDCPTCQRWRAFGWRQACQVHEQAAASA